MRQLTGSLALASLILGLARTARAAQTALEQLGGTGPAIEASAAALRRDVAGKSPLAERLERISRLDRYPAYVEDRIAEQMRLYSGTDTRSLRIQIAGAENDIESRYAGGGCQQTLDEKVAEHRRYHELAVREMSGIHQAQVETVEAVAAKLAADPQADTAAELAAGGNRILALMREKGLLPKDGLAVFEWDRGTDERRPGTTFQSCVNLRSAQATVAPDVEGLGVHSRKRNYVEYRSCVSAGPAGAGETKALAKALYTWGTSAVVFNSEANWVSYLLDDCIRLQALRSIYDARPAR